MVEGSCINVSIHFSLLSAYIREITCSPSHPSKGRNWRERRQVAFSGPPPLGSQSRQMRCKSKWSVPESTCSDRGRELRFKG